MLPQQEITHTVPHLILLLVMGACWGLQFAMLKLAAQVDYSDISLLMISLVLIGLIYSVALTVRGEWFAINTVRLRFLP